MDNEGPHQGESVIHDSVKLGIQGHTLDDDDAADDDDNVDDQNYDDDDDDDELDSLR